MTGMDGSAGPVLDVAGLAVLAAMVLAATAALLAAPDRGAVGDPSAATGGDGAGRRQLGGGWSTLRRRLGDRSRASGDRADAEEVLVLDGLAAALEAGLPTEHALHLVLGVDARPGRGGCWDELRRAAGDGQPLTPVWARVARRAGSPTLAAAARAWTVAGATGAPLASAVRTGSRAARERRRLHRAVEVATAGARATGRVLTLLPLAGVALAWLLGIGPVELYAHPLATGAAGAGVLLLGVGRLLVGRLVADVVRRVA